MAFTPSRPADVMLFQERTGRKVSDLGVWGETPDGTPMRIEYDVIVKPRTPRGTTAKTQLERLRSMSGAIEVRVVARVLGDYFLTITYRPGTDGPVFVGLTIEPANDTTTTPGAAMLRRLGFGSIIDELDAQLRDSRTLDMLGPEWSTRVPRPGRSGTDIHVYLEWAERYVAALAKEPRRPLAHLVREAAERGEHLTVSQVKARIYRARERGLLTKATKHGEPVDGVAGGELTATARRMIAERERQRERLRKLTTKKRGR